MSQWFITAKKADFYKIAEQYHIDPVIARIIRNKDIIEDEDIRKYLYGDKKDLYEPVQMKDVSRAAELIQQNIDSNRKIRVIGDYDADGICSSYILLKGLTLCGANADTVIPHRVKDGYGLNENLIQEAYHDGIHTIVTCDNGIAAANQIAYANQLGMTVIITDHHEIPYEDTDGERIYILPEAEAVVNPKQDDCQYPYKNICGAVVAYKLIQQLFFLMHPKKEMELLEEFLEIAAFATICDVMELRDENRIIVKYGLENMRHTRNAGLKALIEVCGLESKKISAYHIGFILGPCINATGRLDTAKRALSLLQCEKRAEAVQIAEDLKNLNDSRKELTLKGVAEAERYLEENHIAADKVFVIFLPDCHESLAGIIAGRIRETYGKPTFVLTKGEEEVKGSGRSIENYHMYERMTDCKELFIKYGGHKMAAGLSMKEDYIDEFRKRLNENSGLTDEDFIKKVHIDVAMPLSYVTKDLIKELEVLEPFGVGNTKPVFAQKDIHIINGKIMGKNQNVGKYRISDEGGNFYEMIYFGDVEAFHTFLDQRAEEMGVKQLTEGNRTDIVISITYYPGINSYQGRDSIQIVMQNYR